MQDSPIRSSPRWYQRLWHVTTSPAILYWGLPTAVTATAWQQFEEAGYSLGSLLTVSFLIRLVIAILIIGYIGGMLFGAMMRWVGADLESLRPKGKSRPRDEAHG